MGPKLRLYFVSCCCLALSFQLMGQHPSGCDSPRFYYFDSDGDGFGRGGFSQSTLESLQSSFNSGTVGFTFSGDVMYGCMDIAINESGVANIYEFVSNSDDCKDDNEDIFPGSVWYYDNDGDGEGDPNNSKAFDCSPDFPKSSKLFFMYPSLKPTKNQLAKPIELEKSNPLVLAKDLKTSKSYLTFYTLQKENPQVFLIPSSPLAILPMPVLSKAVKRLNPTTLYKIGMGYALKDRKYLVKKKAHVGN